MKQFAKKVYSLIPGWFLLNSRLKSYIHNKPIPKSVQHFEIRPTNIKFIRDDSPIARLAFWIGTDGYESTELMLFERLCSNVHSVCEIGGISDTSLFLGLQRIKSVMKFMNHCHTTMKY